MKIHRFHLVFISFSFSFSSHIFTFPSIQKKIHIVNLVYNYSNAKVLYQHVNIEIALEHFDLSWLESHFIHMQWFLIHLFICLASLFWSHLNSIWFQLQPQLCKSFTNRAKQNTLLILLNFILQASSRFSQHSPTVWQIHMIQFKSTQACGIKKETKHMSVSYHYRWHKTTCITYRADRV